MASPRNAQLQNHVERINGMMLAPHVNKRSNPRSMVIFPVSITKELGRKTHSGIVRDISKEGVFFYSNYRPQPHEIISFVLHMSDSKITCTGQVLRVEQKVPGAAVGIAVKIQSSSAEIG